MTADEIEIAGLKRELITAQTTITNLSHTLKARTDELRRLRSEQADLTNSYLAVREKLSEARWHLRDILDED